MVSYSVNASILPGPYLYDEGLPFQASYNADPSVWQENQGTPNLTILKYVKYEVKLTIRSLVHSFHVIVMEILDDDLAPEDLEETDDLIDDDYRFPTTDQLRNTREKNCKWTGCHRLPITTKMSCPSGTFLESYKMCGARGSGTIDIQCCP